MLYIYIQYQNKRKKDPRNGPVYRCKTNDEQQEVSETAKKWDLGDGRIDFSVSFAPQGYTFSHRERPTEGATHSFCSLLLSTIPLSYW